MAKYAKATLQSAQAHEPAPLRGEFATQPQETRRQRTRARLLQAARRLFFESDYYSLSIDEVAREAGLSRAAFYLHYSSKDEILTEVMREESMKLDPLYHWFNKHKPTSANIKRFILLTLRLGRKARKQVGLFSLSSAYNPNILKTFAENRRRHLNMLGQDLPAFRENRRGKAIERRRNSRAQLLFYQIEQLTVQATFAADVMDIEDQVDAMTDLFRDFLKEYG